MSISRLMQMARAGVQREGWVLDSAAYDNISVSVSTEVGAPFDLFFKPDGTKMYVGGDTLDTVFQYTLSSAWDITSASYDSVSFGFGSQETGPNSLVFKPDGTKMYVMGVSGDDVNEYNLSTAWDVSTASYVQNFSVSAQDTTPRGLQFKPDGTKMYVVGDAGNDINEYNLSVAWDISTASYVQNFSVSTQESGPYAVEFRPDGLKMFVLGAGTRDVLEYSLTTAWDISTATFVQGFDFFSQSGNPRGFQFKTDGTKFYVLDASAIIYQFSSSA